MVLNLYIKVNEEHSEDEAEQTADNLDDKADLSDWCTCDNCSQMDRYVERVCCHEIPQCLEKADDSIIYYEGAEQYGCITENPGFRLICLQWQVVDNAWLAYKQTYRQSAYEGPQHKRRRHVAYRELARFLFGIVGVNNRYILPSCAVQAIRKAYPSPELAYTGFQD